MASIQPGSVARLIHLLTLLSFTLLEKRYQMMTRKWVEIINARLSSPQNKKKLIAILDHVRSGRCPDTGEKINAKLFVSQDFGLDWSIHLTWERDNSVPGKTALGISIANLFSKMGLVSHSVWETVSVEEKN